MTANVVSNASISRHEGYRSGPPCHHGGDLRRRSDPPTTPAPTTAPHPPPARDLDGRIPVVRRTLRILRHTPTLFSALLALACLTLWIRSHYTLDTLSLAAARTYELWSLNGSLEFSTQTPYAGPPGHERPDLPRTTPITLRHRAIAMPAGRVAPRFWPDGFSRDVPLISDDPQTRRLLRTHHVYVPFWMLTLAFAIPPSPASTTIGEPAPAAPTTAPTAATTAAPPPPNAPSAAHLPAPTANPTP